MYQNHHPKNQKNQRIKMIQKLPSELLGPEQLGALLIILISFTDVLLLCYLRNLLLFFSLIIVVLFLVKMNLYDLFSEINP